MIDSKPHYLPFSWSYLKRLGLIALCFATTSCGGGGGGGSAGAAYVRIDANPRVIDSGDRITISIEVADIHESGILLKIRFPTSLAYVPSSAKVITDGDREIDATPSVSASSGSNSFLVFFLTKDDFGRDEDGKVEIELKGTAVVDNAKVEVDADVNDELIPDETEFDIASPEFAAEDEVSVYVED